MMEICYNYQKLGFKLEKNWLKLVDKNTIINFIEIFMTFKSYFKDKLAIR